MENIDFLDSMGSGDSRVEDYTNAQKTEAQRRADREAISLLNDTINDSVNGLFRDYGDIANLTFFDNFEMILGGKIPASQERPDDYIDITLIRTQADTWRTTKIIVGEDTYTVSALDGVRLIDGTRNLEPNRGQLESLDFMLGEWNQTALYTLEDSARLAGQWRESQKKSLEK